MTTRDPFARRLAIPVASQGRPDDRHRRRCQGLYPDAAARSGREPAVATLCRDDAQGASVEAIWSALKLALFHDGKLDLERME